MQYLRSLIILLFCSLIAACSSGSGIYHDDRPSSSRLPGDGELPKGDQGGHQKIGNPYKVAGVWYYPKEQPGYDEVGIASWYGKDFHGKKTANGEYFNMNALTAAHKTLPLPTFVKVTNLSNSRTIILRVNDRGPFVGTRIIDISRRGAQLLGFDKQGTVRVRVQAVDEHGNLPRGVARPRSAPTEAVVAETLPQSSPTSKPSTTDQQTHYVQVGAFGQRQNAEAQVRKLNKSGHRARVEKAQGGNGSFWRVRVGPFIERLIAEQRLDRIVADGFYEARIFSEAVR